MSINFWYNLVFLLSDHVGRQLEHQFLKTLTCGGAQAGFHQCCKTLLSCREGNQIQALTCIMQAQRPVSGLCRAMDTGFNDLLDVKILFFV